MQGLSQVPSDEIASGQKPRQLGPCRYVHSALRRAHFQNHSNVTLRNTRTHYRSAEYRRASAPHGLRRASRCQPEHIFGVHPSDRSIGISLGVIVGHARRTLRDHVVLLQTCIQQGELTPKRNINFRIQYPDYNPHQSLLETSVSVAISYRGIVLGVIRNASSIIANP